MYRRPRQAIFLYYLLQFNPLLVNIAKQSAFFPLAGCPKARELEVSCERGNRACEARARELTRSAIPSSRMRAFGNSPLSPWASKEKWTVLQSVIPLGKRRVSVTAWTQLFIHAPRFFPLFQPRNTANLYVTKAVSACYRASQRTLERPHESGNSLRLPWISAASVSRKTLRYNVRTCPQLRVTQRSKCFYMNKGR